MAQQRVLVTGGSGFIAGHCILQLLDAGYEVRTTVRSLDREASVRQVLTEAGMTHGESLVFVAADLLSDAGWSDAVADVDFVLHVASPVMPGHVENEDDLIVPAREGALRVLRAARAAGVRRVVLTSAFHAVSWGHPHDGHVFTEADWTNLDGPGVDAYGKSKTLAEQAAWAFMADGGLAGDGVADGGVTGRGLADGGAARGGVVDGGSAAGRGRSTELVTMLPVAVLGPVLGYGISGSNHLIQTMMAGGMPGFPNVFIPVVDVRDVAAAHILAMVTPEAAGERFLLSSGPVIALKDIGATIRGGLGEAAGRVPTRSIPDVAVRIAALFSKELRHTVPDLGYAKQLSNEKARRILGWTPRAPQEAILAAAKSLARKNLINA